jgi:hypothetical protein
MQSETATGWSRSASELATYIYMHTNNNSVQHNFRQLFVFCFRGAPFTFFSFSWANCGQQAASLKLSRLRLRNVSAWAAGGKSRRHGAHSTASMRLPPRRPMLALPVGWRQNHAESNESNGKHLRRSL